MDENVIKKTLKKLKEYSVLLSCVMEMNASDKKSLEKTIEKLHVLVGKIDKELMRR